MKLNNLSLTVPSEDISICIQLIEDAILCNNNEKAAQKLHELKQLISNSNNSQDSKKLNRLYTKLEQNIKIIPTKPSITNSLNITPEAMHASPPVGIQRNGNNCCMNAIGQFLLGAWPITTKIFIKIPELKQSIEDIYAVQKNSSEDSSRDTVSPDFGKKLRDWIAKNLTDGEKELKNEYVQGKQVDALLSLHTIFKKAGFSYQFTQKMQDGKEERTLIDAKTGKERIDTQYSIGLDLTKGKRIFFDLFDSFFNDAIEDGKVKQMQFLEAPQDLVIAAYRFGFDTRGIPHKIQDSIEDIPYFFFLNPNYTVHKQKGMAYELLGCMLHEGSLESGHYTYLRKVGNTWYHINDDKVQIIENPQPYLEKGYIYHFQKTDLRPLPEEKPPLEIESSLWSIYNWFVSIIQQVGSYVYSSN